MADDTEQSINPLDFHCCDTPRGMLYYNMEDLTSSQQSRLNELKIKTVREDEQYLAAHPEIRACVALITRHVLKMCPRNNVHDVIAEFFSRSKVDIEDEIKEYIKQREGHNYTGDSAVGLYAPSLSTESSFDDMSTFDDEQDVLSDSLKNIGLNLNEIAQLPSGTLISSISEITDTGLYQTNELEKIKKIIHSQLMEDLIVSEMLDKIRYSDEEPEDDDEPVRFRTSSSQEQINIPISPKVSFSPFVETFVKGAKDKKALGDETVDPTKVEDDIDKVIEEEIEKVTESQQNLLEEFFGKSDAGDGQTEEGTKEKETEGVEVHEEQRTEEVEEKTTEEGGKGIEEIDEKNTEENEDKITAEVIENTVEEIKREASEEKQAAEGTEGQINETMDGKSVTTEESQWTNDE